MWSLQERQKLLADQAPGLIAMRESAAKQLGSAFVFDPESLKILEDDAETLNQKLQEEAAKVRHATSMQRKTLRASP